MVPLWVCTSPPVAANTSVLAGVLYPSKVFLHPDARPLSPHAAPSLAVIPCSLHARTRVHGCIRVGGEGLCSPDARDGSVQSQRGWGGSTGPMVGLGESEDAACSEGSVCVCVSVCGTRVEGLFVGGCVHVQQKV